MTNYWIGTGLLVVFLGTTTWTVAKLEHVAAFLNRAGIALQAISKALLAAQSAYRAESERLQSQSSQAA